VDIFQTSITTCFQKLSLKHAMLQSVYTLIDCIDCIDSSSCVQLLSGSMNRCSAS